MKRIHKIVLVYAVLAVTFTSIFSYLDYHNLESGSKFHQLPTLQRRMVTASAVAMALTNPVSEITTRVFIGGKPRPRHKNYDMTITLFLSLIPSFFFWVWILDKNKEFYKRREKQRQEG